MIVPMKKVSLIIMGDKKSETLKKLRKLGILHIESVEGSGKKLEEQKGLHCWKVRFSAFRKRKTKR